MRSTRLFFAILACLISPTYASISWQAAERFMFSGSDFALSHGAPSGTIETSHRGERPLGNNITKAKNEFRVESDIYKSTSFFQVRTTHPTVDLKIVGSYLSTDATLSVSQRTTLRIDHQITGYFTPRDKFEIELTNQLDDSTVFSLLVDPTSDFSLVTLSPGQYQFSESYAIIGTIIPEPRNRHFSTHLSVSVVPAPTTLAALTPLGFLATRRRR